MWAQVWVDRGAWAGQHVSVIAPVQLQGREAKQAQLAQPEEEEEWAAEAAPEEEAPDAPPEDDPMDT